MGYYAVHAAWKLAELEHSNTELVTNEANSKRQANNHQELSLPTTGRCPYPEGGEVRMRARWICDPNHKLARSNGIQKNHTWTVSCGVLDATRCNPNVIT